MSLATALLRGILKSSRRTDLWSPKAGQPCGWAHSKSLTWQNQALLNPLITKYIEAEWLWGLRKKVRDIASQQVRRDPNSLTWETWVLTGSSPSSLSHFGVSFISKKEKPRLMFLVPHKFPEATTPHLWLDAILRSWWAGVSNELWASSVGSFYLKTVPVGGTFLCTQPRMTSKYVSHLHWGSDGLAGLPYIHRPRMAG